jgi:hypothetical protein
LGRRLFKKIAEFKSMSLPCQIYRQKLIVK